MHISINICNYFYWEKYIT